MKNILVQVKEGRTMDHLITVLKEIPHISFSVIDETFLVKDVKEREKAVNGYNQGKYVEWNKVKNNLLSGKGKIDVEG